MNKPLIAIATIFAATILILGTTLVTTTLPASAFATTTHNGNTVIKQIYSQEKIVSGYGNKIVQEHRNCIITPTIHRCS
jgi:hypothetical protein